MKRWICILFYYCRILYLTVNIHLQCATLVWTRNKPTWTRRWSLPTDRHLLRWFLRTPTRPTARWRSTSKYVEAQRTAEKIISIKTLQTFLNASVAFFFPHGLAPKITCKNYLGLDKCVPVYFTQIRLYAAEKRLDTKFLYIFLSFEDNSSFSQHISANGVWFDCVYEYVGWKKKRRILLFLYLVHIICVIFWNFNFLFRQ